MKKLIHSLSAILLLIAAPLLAVADDEDSAIGIVKQPSTDKAILVTLLPSKVMVASFIMVSHVNDGKPLLCFKDPDKAAISCFVINVKTGQVVFIPVTSSELST